MRRLAAAAALAVCVAGLTPVLAQTSASASVTVHASAVTPARTSSVAWTRRRLAWHYASTQRGCWYVWAGAGPCWQGYDCSGLVVWAYAHAGIWLPHNTYAMLGSGRLTRISGSQLQVGDLVFMYGGGHVELYTGRWGWTFGAHDSGTQVSWGQWGDVYGFYAVRGAG